MKRWMAVVLLILCLAGCGETAAAPQTEGTSSPLPTEDPQVMVGICMPDPQESYWAESAGLLEEKLTQLGYTVEIRYAHNDAREQDRQLQQLLQEGADCLVIGAVDSVELVQTLKQAHDRGIPVVAYDRMLMDTESVSSFVSFDYEAIGSAMAQQLTQQLALETAKEEQRSYKVEFLMGSPDDNNAVLLHKGLLSVLQPWMDQGVLECPSGRVEFADTYILRWDRDLAATRMEQLLTRYYEEKAFPDVCVAASDALAAGCLQALQQAGCAELPVITGQGGGQEALERISGGEQSLSVFADWRLLAKHCAELVKSHVEGAALNTNRTVENHVTQVPAVLCPSTLIHKENYRQVMLDSGLYTEETIP